MAKKLAKKQGGGEPYVASTKSPVVNRSKMKERTGPEADVRNPKKPQPKFDASKVSTNGAKIKGAAKIGSGTYQPDSTTYKKKGGATGAFDKYKAKKK